MALDRTLSAKVGVVPIERVEGMIRVLRGHRVLLDADLAALYEVSVKRLNQQVGRNRGRFPEDFLFQLNAEEHANLRLQFATTSSWGGRRTAPYAFTEQGVAMLSSVLRSPRAVRVNIEVMRAFVRLRQVLAGNADLAKKLEALEARYDAQFKVVFEAIRELMAPAVPPRRRIGFTLSGQEAPGQS